MYISSSSSSSICIYVRVFTKFVKSLPCGVSCLSNRRSTSHSFHSEFWHTLHSTKVQDKLLQYFSWEIFPNITMSKCFSYFPKRTCMKKVISRRKCKQRTWLTEQYMIILIVIYTICLGFTMFYTFVTGASNKHQYPFVI